MNGRWVRETLFTHGNFLHRDFHFWPLRKSLLEEILPFRFDGKLFTLNFSFSVIKFWANFFHVFSPARCSKSLNLDRRRFVYFIDNITRVVYIAVWKRESPKCIERRFIIPMLFKLLIRRNAEEVRNFFSVSTMTREEKANWNEFRAVCSAIIAIPN